MASESPSQPEASETAASLDEKGQALTALLNKLLLKFHRIGDIIINVWVILRIGAKKPREQKSVFNGINLRNAENICNKRTSSRAPAWAG